MDKAKYLIIGNGIAGLSAAREIRNRDKDGSIIMVSKEEYLTYYRVKLTRSLMEDTNPENLLVNKKSWYEEKNIKVILKKIVEKIDVAENIVVLDDGQKIQYEKLLLATGSNPFIPPIQGKFKEGVFALRTIRDLYYIKDYIKDKNNIVIIGGGLLGLEAAWSLRELGKSVSVIEFAPYLLPRQLDEELGEKLVNKLEEKGIKVYLPRSVDEILGETSVSGIRLNNGEIIDTEAILISSGIRPNLDLFRDKVIEIDKGIIVDSQLRTNKENIYAAGDVVQVDNMVIGLWTTANEQGRVAGANMAGGVMEYKHPKLFSSLTIGDIEIFSAGDILNYDQVLLYKDDNRDIHHKLFTKDGKIIGVILFGDIKEMNNLRNAVFSKTDVIKYLETGIPFIQN